MPFCSSIDNSCFFYTQFTPPPLAPDDSKRGVVNLIERKIIPVRTSLELFQCYITETFPCFEFTHFQPMFHWRFSDVLRGYKRGTLVENGLMLEAIYKATMTFFMLRYHDKVNNLTLRRNLGTAKFSIM